RAQHRLRPVDDAARIAAQHLDEGLQGARILVRVGDEVQDAFEGNEVGRAVRLERLLRRIQLDAEVQLLERDAVAEELDEVGIAGDADAAGAGRLAAAVAADDDEQAGGALGEVHWPGKSIWPNACRAASLTSSRYWNGGAKLIAKDIVALASKRITRPSS